MRATRRLWRWRSNPLRRREDIVEAWIILAVWVVVVVGGTVAGAVTAHAAADMLAQQRARRYPVQAVLLADAPPMTAWAAGGQVRDSVRWTAPDGTSRTAWTLVDGGQKRGARVVVWQDGRGRLAPQPTSRAMGAVEAGLFGTAAAFLVAAPALGAGAVARARLDRRRMARWDREWELLGRHQGPRTA
ncbi:hypothetical protein ABZ922_40070 [Streptomyces shenzhenensis]|uniref:Rv1733c family protein n=1 Tax=Streptomyces shenzhenensis TaxID=943815 RepID=UPI0033E754D8